MNQRQTYTVEEIKDMLLAQLDSVVDRYAPPSPDSYTAFGKYFTTNPGRVDRRAGSFYIHMSGPKAGRWRDHAVGDVPGQGYGDVLDLIALSLNCDLKSAFREARAFLGLQTASAEDIARAKQAARRAAERRAEAEAKAKRDAKSRRAQAQRLWLSGQQNLRGTPVDFYLRDARGIDLRQLGRAPGAIRYAPKCGYYEIDPETGEVIEGHWPAMVTAVSDHKGQFVATHRTYLALDAHGQWGKAPVPKPKKVLGDYFGSAINVWRGLGPQGGKPASLPQCPPGTHVYIAEGIEDALSCVLLLPKVRVLSAISLSNLGHVRLPKNVESVTLVADLDENDTARAQLRRAIEQHQFAGREVRVWQNPFGGKDLNDALRAAKAAG